MARARFTLDDAKNLDFEALNERAYALLHLYEADDMETPAQRESRINRTLDELPDIYAWFLSAHAYFDHWTEFYMNQFGSRSLEYKEYRVKRDLMESVAKAAKVRYDGASRRVTQLQRHDEEARMPRTR
jgi:hypothetical protein